MLERNRMSRIERKQATAFRAAAMALGFAVMDINKTRQRMQISFKLVDADLAAIYSVIVGYGMAQSGSSKPVYDACLDEMRRFKNEPPTRTPEIPDFWYPFTYMLFRNPVL